MHFHLNEFHHVYNRGNNKQLIFFSDNNYLFFLKKIRHHLSPVCDIIGYCLMPNHFHLIIYTNTQSVSERKSFGGKPMQELSYRIGILLSSYSQAINKQNGTIGSLFQQKTKAKKLNTSNDSRQYNPVEKCMFYLHQNPVEAKIVNSPSEWAYSSFKDYAGIRNGSLCNQKIFFEFTGMSPKDFSDENSMLLSEKTIQHFYD